MPKIIDSILPILSILVYWDIVLGTYGGPGTHLELQGSTWALYPYLEAHGT